MVNYRKRGQLRLSLTILNSHASNGKVLVGSGNAVGGHLGYWMGIRSHNSIEVNPQLDRHAVVNLCKLDTALA